MIKYLYILRKLIEFNCIEETQQYHYSEYHYSSICQLRLSVIKRKNILSKLVHSYVWPGSGPRHIILFTDAPRKETITANNEVFLSREQTSEFIQGYRFGWRKLPQCDKTQQLRYRNSVYVLWMFLTACFFAISVIFIPKSRWFWCKLNYIRRNYSA